MTKEKQYIVRTGINIPLSDRELRFEPDMKMNKQALSVLKPAQIKQLIKDGVIEEEGD